MSYQYLTTESEDPEHKNNEDQDITTVLVTEQVVDDSGTVLKTKTTKQTLICSCGWERCGLIHRYGLPHPTFRAEIEPITSQHRRDVRALELKS